MHIKSFMMLGFNFCSGRRSWKFLVLFKCIRRHTVRRGPRYLRNYRSVQRTEAAIERLPFKFSTFIYLFFSVFSKKLPLNNILDCFFFHSCTVHLDTIKVFYLPTDAQ